MTSKQRLDRIQRLVSIRERTRDEKRGALAEAQRRVQTATDALEAAQSTWQDHATEVAVATVSNAAEFAEHRMHLASLKRQVERCEHSRHEAEDQAIERRGEARDAQRELRKMELWNESETKKIREEEARRDQIDTDELAAQISQRNPKR